jgi:antitoxin VapB
MFSPLASGGKIMRTAIVYNNNYCQTIHLPAEAHFPVTVKKVSVRIVGQDRIITPLANTWDSFFLQSEVITDDFILTRASQEQQEREAFNS